MQTPRRTTALAALALLLAPALSSCGFDYATDRDYPVTVGATDRSGEVDVLSGVVVSAEDGEGVVVTSLANNSATESISLTELTGEGVTVSGFSEVEVPESGFVNLADGDSPIKVSGDFEAGNFIPLTLAFSNGDQISIKMQVRRNCGDYADVAGLREGAEICPSGNDLLDEGGH